MAQPAISITDLEQIAKSYGFDEAVVRRCQTEIISSIDEKNREHHTDHTGDYPSASIRTRDGKVDGGTFKSIRNISIDDLFSIVEDVANRALAISSLSGGWRWIFSSLSLFSIAKKVNNSLKKTIGNSEAILLYALYKSKNKKIMKTDLRDSYLKEIESNTLFKCENYIFESALNNLLDLSIIDINEDIIVVKHRIYLEI